jgi:uncharacterized protein (UPF0333 family)
MELFLPGLVVFVAVGFFAFLVIPRMGSMILAIICLIALIAAGVHHYTLFSSEYAMSTWQYGLASYAPFVVLGLAILFIIAGILYMFSSPEKREVITEAIKTPMEAAQEAVAEAVTNITAPSNKPANSITNTIVQNINKGINAVKNTILPASNTSSNKPNPRRSPNIPGLGFSASQI